MDLIEIIKHLQDGVNWLFENGDSILYWVRIVKEVAPTKKDSQTTNDKKKREETRAYTKPVTSRKPKRKNKQRNHR